MKSITSWELRGREIGRLEGKIEGWFKGWIEGWMEGWVEGMLEAKCESTIKLLTWRLGQISQGAQKRINQLPLDKVDKLFDAAFDFEQKSDLDAWLRKHAAIRRAASRGDAEKMKV